MLLSVPFVGVLVERLAQGEKLTTEILRVHLARRLDAAALQSCLSLHRCYIPNGCCSSREVTGCLTAVLLLIISVSGSIRSLWGTDFLCWSHPLGKLYVPPTLA